MSVEIDKAREQIEADQVEADARIKAAFDKEKADGNAVVAATILLNNRHAIARARARIEATSPAPVPVEMSPERAEYERLKRADPVGAARLLLSNRNAIFPRK